MSTTGDPCAVVMRRHVCCVCLHTALRENAGLAPKPTNKTGRMRAHVPSFFNAQSRACRGFEASNTFLVLQRRLGNVCPASHHQGVGPDVLRFRATGRPYTTSAAPFMYFNLHLPLARLTTCSSSSAPEPHSCATETRQTTNHTSRCSVGAADMQSA